MANKTLHSLQFPGLSDTYVVPEEAPEFSTSSTYAVGQYVTYRGVLYKCITAVSHAGSWTGSTNWSATDVGTELQDTYGPSRPNFSTNTPVMDGAASTGSATTYARSDHRHPSDTTKLNVPDNAGTLGQALTKTATGSTWKTLTEGINPNLLRNWYFVGGGTGKGVFPVNQRGQSSYSGAYSIDGWHGVTASQMTLTSGYITIASTTYWQDASPEILKSLLGKSVTASALLADGTLVTGTAVYRTSYSGNNVYNYGTQGILKYGVTNSGAGYQCLRLEPGSYVAVKLELGSQQTLAHQENGVWVLNEIPDYEEEYYRCITSDADSGDTYANKVLSTNIPHKNLLDNWYFRNPVNQRGQSSYSTDGAYTIDRWKLGGAVGTASFDSSGVLMSSQTLIGNLIETSRVTSGATYTISALWTNGLITATGTLVKGSGTSIWQIQAGGAIAARSIAIRQLGTSTFQIIVVGDGTNKAIAAKLELGTEQTLAHQENGVWVLNEIPDYEEEYYRCITSDADSGDTYANQKVSNITVQCNSVGSSSLRYYNSLIQSTHKVLDSTFSNPAAQTSDITVTTYDGYLDFSNGFASGATTNITLVLGTSGPVLSTSTTAPS